MRIWTIFFKPVCISDFVTVLLQDHYTSLIKELKQALEPEGLLLSAAVGPGKATIDESYNLPEIAK